MQARRTANKTVILLTTHVWRSKRRAGFHWVADSLWRQGWEVYFLSDPLSLIERLRNDYRVQCTPREALHKLVREDDRLFSYVPTMLYRPITLRSPLLDRLTYPLFVGQGERLALPGLEEIIRKADLFIFESSSALLLFERFKAANPQARFTYRVSDDLDLFRTHPIVLDTEKKVTPRFDLVSVPYPAMLPKFTALTERVQWHPHGVPTHLFDQALDNPYAGLSGSHAVFPGVILFDTDFLTRASALFPQLHFHIIGPHERKENRPNVHYYGELPFQETLPYLAHADLGLQCTLSKGGMGSNKAMLYTHCRLPIVASAGNETRDWPHIFLYQPGDDESIATAIRSALAFDRRRVPAEAVTSWDDVAAGLAGELWHG